METLPLLVLLLAGSFVVAALISRPARCSDIRQPVLPRLLEFAGLWAACLGANLLVGVLLILALRSLARVFVSVYVLNDVSLVIVSALQAFALHARSAARP